MQHGLCFGFTYRCFNSVWWFGGFQCGVVHVPNPPRSECFWCRMRSLRLGCMTWIARRGRAVGCRLQAAFGPQTIQNQWFRTVYITFIFPMNICTFMQFWDLSQFRTNPLDSCVELCVKMPGMAWFCARLAQGRGYERKCLGRGSGRPNKADRRANNLMATRTGSLRPTGFGDWEPLLYAIWSLLANQRQYFCNIWRQGSIGHWSFFDSPSLLTLLQAGTSFTAVFRVVWFNQLEPRRDMFKAGTFCAVMLWFGPTCAHCHDSLLCFWGYFCEFHPDYILLPWLDHCHSLQAHVIDYDISKIGWRDNKNCRTTTLFWSI